jgi:hypothetical protein
MNTSWIRLLMALFARNFPYFCLSLISKHCSYNCIAGWLGKVFTSGERFYFHGYKFIIQFASCSLSETVDFKSTHSALRFWMVFFMHFLHFAQFFGTQWLLSCLLCDIYLFLSNIPSQLLLSFPLHFFHNKLIHPDVIINIPNTTYDKLDKTSYMNRNYIICYHSISLPPVT